MKKLTGMQRRAIMRKAELCINPSSNVGEIVLHDDKIYIEVLKYDFGNFVDAGSLMSLLVTLKDLGVVGLNTRTMWVGMFTNSHFKRFELEDPHKSRMWVWCSL
jgi:hypothetical protein